MANEANTVKVWDLFIRVFHWLLVMAFFTAYLTEGEYFIHFYAGWLIVALLVLRIIWGFVGTQYARFSDFVKPPAVITHYAKSLLSGGEKSMRYLGHNPLGGVMIVAMIFSLAATTFSGIQYYGSENPGYFAFVGENPLHEAEDEDRDYSPSGQHEQAYDRDDDEDEAHERYEQFRENAEREYHGDSDHEDEHEEDEFWEELHEFFANFTLFLVLLHILGVVVSSRTHNENLVLAMLTGHKRRD